MTPGGADIFAGKGPRIFSMEPGRAFLSELAREVRRSIAARADLELADALIYLPTRRAVRALGDAFAASAPDAQASLLPRIRALGDIDEDEFVLFEGDPEDEFDLSPAISLMERRFVLAQMVAAKDRAFDGQERWAGALSAADELGKLLDSFYTEEIPPEALHDIQPEGLADHWRRSLDFLSIIIKTWPDYLAERGLTDPADRRVKLIDRQTKRWREAPPQTPIMIAGTTGSAPAVARMIAAVANAPMGCVLLPGLDLASDERFWSSIDETHPQNGLRQLLRELRLQRSDVAPWPGAANERAATRNDILTVSLRPADASDSWRDWARTIETDRTAMTRALENVELIEAQDEEREASAIAVKIRAALEDKSKSIMLVTPDRDLSRRVAVKMRRWNVAVDDSAGMPFANSPCGIYLRLVAAWLSDPSDAVALTAVLRHPLFGGGIGDAPRASTVSALDLALRGVRPKSGAEGLKEKLAADEKNGPKAKAIADMLCDVLDAWPVAATFQTRYEAHLAIAEKLAQTNTASGAERLWRGADGEAGAAALAMLSSAVAAISNDHAREYPDIFLQLIANAVVRRTAPTHPRIAILGPLEARLQHADIVILGGLNEGVWPRDAAIDPFLSRPMRKAINLPSPEHRIALAAHDFAQLAAAPEIVLTRQLTAGGKPTKPSRWIVRLKNILKGANALEQIDKTHVYETLSDRLDEPIRQTRIKPPAPRPPNEARPKALFVTRVEKLLRDPYAVYARDILRLKKLDEHNEELDARHIGNLFHKILQLYAQTPPPDSHNEQINGLLSLFDAHASAYGLTDSHIPFWRARAGKDFDWLAGWDAARRNASAPAVVEEKGRWAFVLDGQEFALSAKADRIDKMHDGGAFVIDYKTGAPPTLRQTKKFSPQLPLTGLIVAHGGFEPLGAAPVVGFEYVRVVNRKGLSSDTVSANDAESGRLLEEAETGLHALLRHFNDPNTPYPSQPRPQYMDDFGDYDHLARRRERNALGDES